MTGANDPGLVGRRSRWPWAFALATFAAGVALTLWLHARLVAAERRAVERAFAAEAAMLHGRIEQELRLHWEVLDSIRLLHSISEQIRPEDFLEFVEKGMLYQRRVLGAFGFAQRIGHPVRLAIETSDSAAPGLRIVERSGDGSWESAGVRPEYYPLTWQHPPDAFGLPVGHDFAADPESARAIGAMARSSVSSLLPDPAGAPGGFLALAAIYFPPQPGAYALPPSLKGFAFSRLHPRAVLERALAQGAPQGLRAVLRDAGEGAVPPEWAAAPYRFVRELPVANRRWVLECMAGEGYAPAAFARQSPLALWAGLLVTLLVGSQLALLAGRARRIEEEVMRRTADLRAANRQLEEAMAERSRLEAALHDAGRTERQKLGRDLHDSLGQKLTGAVFLSRSLLTHLRESADGEAAHAQKLNEVLKDAVGQVRGMARGLAPVEFGGESLGEALARLAEEVAGLYPVACAAEAGDYGAEPEERIREQLYLVAKEAANNAARHSGAERIAIALRREAGALLLEVEDDGRGLPPEATARGGMGLRIMQARAKMIGAAIAFENLPGGGLRVRCALGA